MDNLIIETEELTKYFGEISAVKDVHLHVKKVRYMVFWEEMVQGKQRL